MCLAIHPGKSEMQNKAIICSNRTASLPNDPLSMKEEKSGINMLVYMRNGRLYIVRSRGEILPVAEGTK